MSKWLITVADKDDKRMAEIEKSYNEAWINEWVGEAVEIEDMQRMQD